MNNHSWFQPSRRAFALLGLLFGLLATPLLAQGTKLALVIGNDAYETDALATSVNDATDLSATLQSLGFRVTTKTNADLATMKAALADFRAAIKEGDTALFFYAGHGGYFKDNSYLIPVNAAGLQDRSLDKLGLNVLSVIDAMKAAKAGTRLILLDAGHEFRYPGSSIFGGRWQPEVEDGTLWAFASAPGRVAMSSANRNGHFAAALVKNLAASGRLSDVMETVMADAKKGSGGRQLGKLVDGLGEFSFANPVVAAAAKPADEPAFGSAFSSSVFDAFPAPAAEPAPAATMEYRIGDTGPAGGTIFYDKGQSSDGWRYLEAAPSDTGVAGWGKNMDLKSLGTAIGTGKANTAQIVQALGAGSYAAQLCKNLNLGGATDWFLPSKDELNLLYTNLARDGMGGFMFGQYDKKDYWSSSQMNNHLSLIQAFGAGEQTYQERMNSLRVRAIRSF